MFLNSFGNMQEKFIKKLFNVFSSGNFQNKTFALSWENIKKEEEIKRRIMHVLVEEFCGDGKNFVMEIFQYFFLINPRPRCFHFLQWQTLEKFKVPQPWRNECTKLIISWKKNPHNFFEDEIFPVTTSVAHLTERTIPK